MHFCAPEDTFKAFVFVTRQDTLHLGSRIANGANKDADHPEEGTPRKLPFAETRWARLHVLWLGDCMASATFKSLFFLNLQNKAADGQKDSSHLYRSMNLPLLASVDFNFSFLLLIFLPQSINYFSEHFRVPVVFQPWASVKNLPVFPLLSNCRSK